MTMIKIRRYFFIHARKMFKNMQADSGYKKRAINISGPPPRKDLVTYCLSAN